MIPYKRLVLLVCCLPLITGCWDNIEVEERGFVTGIAIDLANNENSTQPPTSNEQSGQNEQQPNEQQNQNQQQSNPSEQQNQIQQQSNPNEQQDQNQQQSNPNEQQNQNETPLNRDERVLNHENDEDSELNENNKFKLTQQLIIPSSLGSQQSSNTNQNSTAFRNLSQTGDTIIEMNRDMIKQAGRRTNVTHLNVVLFSESVAQEEHLFADLMDIFLREKEMLRSVKIVITKNHASDYLNIIPENEQIPSKYLSKVLENKSNLDIAQPLTVGDVQSHLLSHRSFIIPFINKVNETTVNYDGLSVYSGSKRKIVGNLMGDDAKGVNFIQSKNQTGTINTKVDDHDVTFEILEVKSKIALKDKNKRPLQFQVTIDVEAAVAEQYGSLDIMKEKNYKKLQKALEKEIKQISNHTVSILQTEYETDVIGLNSHLYEKYYPLWESIKDDWEKGKHYFKNSEVHITVNATIEKPGNIIKSH